jgi:polyisoprenoid-binding protein YceI
MKKLFSLITLIAVSSLLVAAPVKPIKKVVDVAKSTIGWTGAKITGKHNGTVNIKSGSIEIDADKLKGGSFIIDMPSITVSDLSGGGKTKLEGHLKNDDFFGVEKHAEASLTITKVTPKAMAGEYMVDANLTIKGITQAIKFEAKATATSASAKIKVDRTKFDIKYGSGSFFENLGDKAIMDEFELDVNLAF